MPIHQIAPRVVKFKNTEAIPSFPAHVELVAELGPDEVFGEADLSGRLTLSPPGQTIDMAADMFHGGFSAVSKARLAKPNVTVPFFDLSLTIEGKIARVFGDLKSEADFRKFIQRCINNLPAFICCAFGAPIIVQDLYGNVGSAYFQVEIKGDFLRVISTPDPNQAISKQMTALRELPDDASGRVFAAQRYLNQAQWLGYLAKHSQQFSAEQLLNLQKAVEILYPCSGSTDQLRIELRKLGLREEVVELFASIKYVRNSVDVGHPSLAAINEAQYNTFHQFLQCATQLVTWLVNYTVERLAQETSSATPEPHTGGTSSELGKTLNAVHANMEKVNFVEPTTFFASEATVVPPPQPMGNKASKKSQRDRSNKKNL